MAEVTDGGVVAAGLGAGLRWLARGGPGRRGGAVFTAWAPVWQASLAAVVGGAVVFAASDALPWRAGGASLAALGLLALAPGILAAAALEATVPPPRRPPAPTSASDGPLDEVVAGVAVARRPRVVDGLRVGARTAVIDAGEGLILVAPVAPEPALVEAVRTLGEVRWIVAAGADAAHVAAWLDALPGAVTWTPSAPVPWPREVVDVEVVPHPAGDEPALLHRPSRTLVVGGLLRNLGADAVDGAAARWLARLRLDVERPGPTVAWKLTLADRAAARAAVARIGAWGAHRIVPEHGAVIERDVAGVWRDAFAFLDRS